MKEKKLLYISNRVFWPPMGGHEVEMYHYCRGLHEKYGYTVDIYVFDSEETTHGIQQPAFLNKIYFARFISKGTKIRNIVFKSIISNDKWPIQSSLYYSNENAGQIRKLVQEQEYDLVFVDMIRLATYYHALRGINCKKVLDIDDTLSKRYKRQIASITKKTVIAGQYHEKLPHFIQKILGSNLIKKVVLRLEIPRMEKAEQYYSGLFDRVIFVSPIETDEFNKKYKTDKAITVSLGVDYSFFSEEISVKKEDGKVTFVGNMATPANADSVRFIIDEVIPNCKNVKKIIFVGNCPDSLRNSYADNEKVEFTGKVDDLRKYVKGGIVFLAPIAYGTGIKTKILEAMAMGMPVVTNSIGAEGIAAKNGIQWYVSDDTNELACYVDELLINQSKCDLIGRKAKEFVKTYYQWDIIFEQLKKIGLEEV